MTGDPLPSIPGGRSARISIPAHSVWYPKRFLQRPHCSYLTWDSSQVQWNHRIVLEPTDYWLPRDRLKFHAERRVRQILHDVMPLERSEPPDLLEYIDPTHILPIDVDVEHPLPSNRDPQIDLRKVEPDHVVEPRVDRQEILESSTGGHGGDGGRIEFCREVIGRLIGAKNPVTAGGEGLDLDFGAPVVGVRLPDAGEGVGVVGEAGTEWAGAGGEAAVVDEDEVGAGAGTVVGEAVDGGDLEGGDDGGVGRDGVEADVEGGVGDGGDEIGVGAGAGGGLGPGGAPAEDEGALDGDVEARGAEFAVVVVVDGEGAEVVAPGGDGDGVAVLLAGGVWGEEAESGLLGLGEAVGFGDHRRGAGGEEAVGEPGAAELGGEVGGTAAVDVIGDTGGEGIGRGRGGDEEGEGEEKEERHFWFSGAMRSEKGEKP